MLCSMVLIPILRLVWMLELIWRFSFADEVGDGQGGQHDFSSHDDTGLVGIRQELLADDRFQAFSNHRADLGLLIWWEDVKYAVHRRGGAAGVQGAENEVPGFGCPYGHFNGFEVSQFTDYDVGSSRKTARRALWKLWCV